MGIFEVILAFMEKGGDVLWLIAALVFFMWTLIFERVWSGCVMGLVAPRRDGSHYERYCDIALVVVVLPYFH